MQSNLKEDPQTTTEHPINQIDYEIEQPTQTQLKNQPQFHSNNQSQITTSNNNKNRSYTPIQNIINQDNNKI
jgi:hypothetical protein